MKITGPIASIVITIVLAVSTLFGIGAFSSESYNFATIHHNEGYKRVGVISEERIYTSARISSNGGQDVIVEGDFKKIKNFLEDGLDENSESEDLNLMEGILIEAAAGIDWTASLSNFRLAVEKYSELSTNEKPIEPRSVISKLQELEKAVISRREEVSANAIRLGPKPPSDWSAFALRIVEDSLSSLRGF